MHLITQNQYDVISSHRIEILIIQTSMKEGEELAKKYGFSQEYQGSLNYFFQNQNNPPIDPMKKKTTKNNPHHKRHRLRHLNLNQQSTKHYVSTDFDTTKAPTSTPQPRERILESDDTDTPMSSPLLSLLLHVEEPASLYLKKIVNDEPYSPLRALLQYPDWSEGSEP